MVDTVAPELRVAPEDTVDCCVEAVVAVACEETAEVEEVGGGLVVTVSLVCLLEVTCVELLPGRCVVAVGWEE